MSKRMDIMVSTFLVVGTILMLGIAIRDRWPAHDPRAPRRLSESLEVRVPAAAWRLGSSAAPFVIVEFSDFECPACANFAMSAFDDVRRTLIDSGTAEYVVVNRPLASIHPRAFRAAEAAECAGRQGKYWAMRDGLFRGQHVLNELSLVERAATLALDVGAFRRCLGGEAEARVQEDNREAIRLEINGTPKFLVGTRGPNGAIAAFAEVNGAASVGHFVASLQMRNHHWFDRFFRW